MAAAGLSDPKCVSCCFAFGTKHAVLNIHGQRRKRSSTRSVLTEPPAVQEGDHVMKRIAMTLVMMCALIGLGTQASAQCGSRMGGFGYSGGGYGGYGYSGGYGYGGGGYGGGGYGQPGSYYGNGGHDLQPHGHVTQTPYGPSTWYGTGPHDLVPHQHSRTPWSYQGFSNTGAGPTTSFYNQQPTYFAPW